MFKSITKIVVCIRIPAIVNAFLLINHWINHWAEAEAEADYHLIFSCECNAAVLAAKKQVQNASRLQVWIHWLGTSWRT